MSVTDAQNYNMTSDQKRDVGLRWRELIDWNAVPDDPIFRLTFPHKDMLSNEQFERIRELQASGEKEELKAAIREIQLELNPHPAGQMTHNVPTVAGEPVPGVQHKDDQTPLFVPASRFFVMERRVSVCSSRMCV